ncbi:MAG: hypothetical protein BWY63_01779 [Chloroflexi bacterium ADurb.Bin360]|nr:MAG: hypothetical protein BWY63_01779 [Chloroflexi bacterium ADurb.Bin360]
MKECSICGEQLDDHALKCSKGHSVFRLERGKQVFSNERQIVVDMLRQSSVGYTEDEIVDLVDEIVRILQVTHTPITKSVLETIARNIENPDC